MLINEKTTIAMRKFIQGAVSLFLALYNTFAPAVYNSKTFTCNTVTPGVQMAVLAVEDDGSAEADADEDKVMSEEKVFLTDLSNNMEAVSVTTAFVPDNTVCEITGDACVAYDNPECTGAPAAGLENGSEVIRTGIGNGVDRIVTEDGHEMYVVKYAAIPSSILEAAEAEALAEEEEEITPGQQIADIAVSMIGTPYIFAGASENGVDCSGLVVYCYNQLGVELPHYSGSLCSVGEEVDIEDIMPGDIICWNNGGGHCGHVGIYVGDGQCVDARGRRDGVIYADLDLHPILTVRRIFT